jgi:predicted O-methyltransferase YrrM
MDAKDQWSQIDEYLVSSLLPADAVLDETLRANAKAGLPAIDVSPNQGRLLQLIAQVQGARSILEVGTLGGYSTIWLARALPAGGRMVTLEYNPKHAEVARSNLARAGLSEIVEVRVGAALDTLPGLAEEASAEQRTPFDLVFIDADKPNNPSYVTWAVRLTRPGSVIIVDNVVRSGGILDAKSEDAAIQGTRRLFEVVAAERRLHATAIQTVGSKGHDGFLMARVVGP